MDPEKTVYYTTFAATINVEMEVLFEAANDEEARKLAHRMAQDQSLMEELANGQHRVDGFEAAVMYEPQPHKYQSANLTERVEEWCNSQQTEEADAE